MHFEFDAAKSQANRAKHGIDFEEAQALWNGGGWFELPLISEGEPRCLIVGMIGDKHWAAIITYRGDRIRIISVRRARDVEIACYEG